MHATIKKSSVMTGLLLLTASVFLLSPAALANSVSDKIYVSNRITMTNKGQGTPVLARCALSAASTIGWRQKFYTIPAGNNGVPITVKGCAIDPTMQRAYKDKAGKSVLYFPVQLVVPGQSPLETTVKGHNLEQGPNKSPLCVFGGFAGEMTTQTGTMITTIKVSKDPRTLTVNCRKLKQADVNL